MKIHFGNNKLEKILSNPRLIKKYYPREFNDVIIRLKELTTVDNLSLISHRPPPRRHKLKGEYRNCWAVDISMKKRIIFKPKPQNIIKLKEIKEIKEIEIIKIADYHI